MNTLCDIDRKAFIAAFIAAAQWQAKDDDGEDMDEYEFSPGAVATMTEWCNEFMDTHCQAIEKYQPTEAGTCFALSANGHGAGFCDHIGSGSRGKESRMLMDASKKYAYNIWLDANDNLCIE